MAAVLDLNEDTAFAFIMLASVPWAFFMRLLPASQRPLAGALTGVFALLATCNAHALSHLASAVLYSAVLLAGILPTEYTPPVPEEVRMQFGAVVATFNFAHLGLSRSGVLGEPLGGVANAAHLIMTLRLTSAAFDVSDGSGPQSMRELVLYATSFHGLLTGPFLTHSAWSDAMRAPPPQPGGRFVVGGLLRAVSFLAIWRAVCHLLPYGLIWDDAAWEGGLCLPAALGGLSVRRLGYFFLSSYQYRWRFYSAWAVTEVAGAVLGLADPVNVRMWDVEYPACPSVYIAAWNISVVYYLKRYVYRRLPTGSRTLRQLGTFAASAYWHGTRPGFYLFFCGLWGLQFVEHIVRTAYAAAASRGWVGEGPLPPALHFACFSWTMLCFSFFGVAFNLKETDLIREKWAVLGHFGTRLLLAPLPICLAVVVATQPQLLSRGDNGIEVRRLTRLARASARAEASIAKLPAKGKAKAA